jgi:uncharacterized membrane protein YfcA
VIFGVDAGVVAVLAGVVLLGATIQGLVGLGVGLVSSPFVTMLAPDLMPGLLLFLGFLTPSISLLADHRDIDWRGLAWAVPWRIPGTVVGVWLVAVVSGRALEIAVGTMVLLSVVVTWRAVELPINRTNLSVAGLVSGVTATTTSIGGPSIAVLYQHQPARRIRSTLAVYFATGAVFSLTGLALAGQITRAEIGLAALSVPALVLGIALSVVIRNRIRPDSIRSGVLVVCAASAVTLLARALL